MFESLIGKAAQNIGRTAIKQAVSSAKTGLAAFAGTTALTSAAVSLLEMKKRQEQLDNNINKQLY